MKGIILAGGSGSRLYPLTTAISKQLLPVYDKPMIYYPLSLMMKLGIRQILIITSKESLGLFKQLLGTGIQWGVEFSFLTQDKPRGIAESLVIGEKFLNGSNSLLALGDNLIITPTGIDQRIFEENSLGATIFAHEVSNPNDYGVVQFDSEMRAKKIVEKPKTFISPYAIPGLYFFDSNAPEYAKSIKPSFRMEFEIVDVIQQYLDIGSLRVSLMPAGTVWLDMGSFSQLRDAGSIISSLQSRLGSLIGSPDEVALDLGWISKSQARENVAHYPESNSYSAAIRKRCIA